MKKLSLILAMVLIATIGGVYATWTYAEADVSGHLHLTPIMADVTTDTASGTLSIGSGSTMKIYFDDGGSHVATLSGSGDLIVVFQAHENSTEYNDSAVYFNWNLATSIKLPGDSTNGNWFNDGSGAKAIFTAVNPFAEDKTITLTPTGNPGEFKGTISWSTIAAQITANTFALEDYEEFQSFQAQLTHVGNIGFDFTQTNAPALE